MQLFTSKNTLIEYWPNE